MTKRTKIIIGAVLALCLGIFLLFRGGDLFGQSSVTVPIMELSNSDMQETQKGEVVWRLKAKRVTIAGDKDTATMEDVDGYFKDKDIELSIKAKTGRVVRSKKWVYLEGDVRGKTSDGAELSAENLTYDGKTQKLSTDKHFILTRDGRELTADSFEADRVLETMKAKGHAKLRTLDHKSKP